MPSHEEAVHACERPTFVRRPAVDHHGGSAPSSAEPHRKPVGHRCRAAAACLDGGCRSSRCAARTRQIRGRRLKRPRSAASHHRRGIARRPGVDQLADQARQVDEALAGGQSKVTISTTVIIIILLVLIRHRRHRLTSIAVRFGSGRQQACCWPLLFCSARRKARNRAGLSPSSTFHSSHNPRRCAAAPPPMVLRYWAPRPRRRVVRAPGGPQRLGNPTTALIDDVRRRGGTRPRSPARTRPLRELATAARSSR